MYKIVNPEIINDLPNGTYASKVIDAKWVRDKFVIHLEILNQPIESKFDCLLSVTKQIN